MKKFFVCGLLALLFFAALGMAPVTAQGAMSDNAFAELCEKGTAEEVRSSPGVIRKLKGLREEITTGTVIDTLIQMEPMDLVFSKGQQETLTSSELRQYISKQTERGSCNVVQYEVEYHKRIATSFASFILTIIGVSLSSRKRKGGMGLYLGIGLALSFTYILLQTVSATFAINADTPPMLAAWIPNLLYVFIAYFCYKQAPN